MLRVRAARNYRSVSRMCVRDLRSAWFSEFVAAGRGGMLTTNSSHWRGSSERISSLPNDQGKLHRCGAIAFHAVTYRSLNYIGVAGFISRTEEIITDLALQNKQAAVNRIISSIIDDVNSSERNVN